MFDLLFCVCAKFLQNLTLFSWGPRMRVLFSTAAILLAVGQLTSSTGPMTSSTVPLTSPADQLMRPDVFSSVSELSGLLARERDFYEGLHQLADKLEASANILRNFQLVRI